MGDEQPLQQVGPVLGLFPVKDGPPGDDLHLEGDILIQNLPQGQHTGLGLVVHQGQQDDAEGDLHLGLCKETVQYHLRIGVLFQLDNNPHALLAVAVVL